MPQCLRPYVHGCRVVSFAVAALLLSTQESPAADRLIVRNYNNGVVRDAEMSRARAVANDILRAAGVEAVWRDCSAGCDDRLGAGEVVVRIVAAPGSAAAGSMGCAVIDVDRKIGALATVYVDRVMTVSSRAGVSAAILLGRALAHEIGHLLLGTADHSETGLMRALWSDRELQLGLPADWNFAPEDAARIGRRIDRGGH
jgi:hypothetical protein